MRSGVRISPGAPYEIKKTPLVGGLFYFIRTRRIENSRVGSSTKSYGTILNIAFSSDNAMAHGAPAMDGVGVYLSGRPTNKKGPTRWGLFYFIRTRRH